MIIKCEVCENEFKTYPSRIKIGKGKYCSKTCQFEAQRGRPTPRRGIKLTSEQKSKLNLKGLELGRGWNRGIPCSEVTKKKISMANKGHISWNKGIKSWVKPWLGKKRPNMVGEKNKEWKGNNVGYQALHDWVKKRFKKPDFCPQCHSSKYIQLANISFEYKRDLSDWMYLCASCHRYYDRKNGWGMATKKFDLNSKT